MPNLLCERGLWCHSSRQLCSPVSMPARPGPFTWPKASGHSIGRRRQHACKLWAFQGTHRIWKGIHDRTILVEALHGVHRSLLMQMGIVVPSERQLTGAVVKHKFSV